MFGLHQASLLSRHFTVSTDLIFHPQFNCKRAIFDEFLQAWLDDKADYLIGLFSGALVALPPAIFPQICTRPELLGTWMGMGWIGSGIAFWVGAPIAGALLDSGSVEGVHNFLATQLWSGLILILGAGSLLVLWGLLIRQNKHQNYWI